MKFWALSTRQLLKPLRICHYKFPCYKKRILHVEASQKVYDVALQGSVRTRFAPSPTGNLHIGSLRTAVFNYLLAKKYGGQFILRLEDTDRKRIVPGAEEGIYRDLRWAGLSWDEGPGIGGPYGPYRQSENTNLYRSQANALIRNGHAYRCFCTDDNSDIVDEAKLAGFTRLNQCPCAGLSEEESQRLSSRGKSFAIRLRNSERDPEFHDVVYGKLNVGSKRFERGQVGSSQNDLVLLKSDGLPTYHLANVVDDHRMKITHVIRGTEWIKSTPKHVALYKAFGWEPPRFAHVSLLLNESGQKFSKRDGNTSIENIRHQNVISPAALVNYVALLGWSCQRKNEVMSLTELAENFSLKFSKGDVKVTPEKLNFLNAQHGKRFAAQGDDQIVDPIVERVEKTFQSALYGRILRGRSLHEYVKSILIADAKNFQNVDEFCDRNSYFFVSLEDYSDINDDEKAAATGPVYKSSLINSLSAIPEDNWDQANITAKLQNLCENPASTSDMYESGDAKAMAVRKCKRDVQLYLRAAIAKGHHGPGIVLTMELLGKDICLERLSTCILKGNPVNLH